MVRCTTGRAHPGYQPTRGGSAMTFKEVLANVIDWLQQDQRISYRALKRQFALDDDYLEDLKVELIEVRQVALDQDGKILVWGGALPPLRHQRRHPSPSRSPTRHRIWP